MKNVFVCRFFIMLVVIGLFSPAAFAQRNTAELVADGWVMTDFPGPEMPDTFGNIQYPWVTGGTTGDSVFEGDQALYLGEEARAWYRFADEPAFGSLSFYVYDKGASFSLEDTIHGPRWGVQNNPSINPIPFAGTPFDEMMAVEMIGTSLYDANVSYSFNPGFASGPSDSSTHFDTLWPGGLPGASFGESAYRRVAGATEFLPAIGSGYTFYDPPNNVQGAWSKWTFTVHAGADMVIKVTDADGVSNEQSWVVIPAFGSIFDTGVSTTGFNQLHFYGGNFIDSGYTDQIGLWIDDIVFTPDPGEVALEWTEDFNSGLPADLCAIRGSEGDFNCDAVINLLDLDILGSYWPLTGLDPATSYTLGDTNADGTIGLLDLNTLGMNFGLPISIPEPATLGLFAITTIIAIRRR